VQDLSRLLYNRHGGNPREIKQNILNFNGFVFPDAKTEVSGTPEFVHRRRRTSECVVVRDVWHSCELNVAPRENSVLREARAHWVHIGAARRT
jgi:hypothetical protein